MRTANRPLRHLAGMLACVLVLFGTTGVAAFDALAHASQAHASQHENDNGPQPQGSDCLLCVASAAPADQLQSDALVPEAAPGNARDAVTAAARAPHTSSYYLTPPGRGPPTA